MLTIEQAQQLILDSVQVLPSEPVELGLALGRFAAEPVRAAVDLPVADNSAMDGYAVRAEDLAQATAESPLALRLIGVAPAGTPLDSRVEPGTCARVFTGSVLPAGADAVVMQEDVQRDERDPTRLLFAEKAPPWQYTRLRGEDVKANAVILQGGEKLTAGRLALLAASGISQVRVGRRPGVGLIATGNELREAGQPLTPGTIYEGNRAGLAALAVQCGACPKIYPLVADDLTATARALERALSECDFVVSTGGVSVGEMDWVKAAFEQVGGRLELWTVSMRPGKPFAFGRRQEKLFFGLPGNPVSAFVTFLLLARPALLRAQGGRDIFLRRIPAELSEALANSGERRHFMRVLLDAQGRVRSAGSQSSHVLSALAQSTGLVDVPPKTTLPAGAIASVLMWD